jgi:Zn-dependent protease with chaperone function
MIYAPALLIFVLMIPLAFGRSLAINTPAFIFSPMLIGVVGMAPYSFFLRQKSQKHEFEADRLAAEVTGNVAAAKSALRKITLNSVAPGVHDTDMGAHPTISARLAALSELR